MPIKNLHYVVYDYETTGLDPYTVEPIEIGAQIYNGRSLELIPGAEFNMLCKPSPQCIIDPKIYEITKIDPKDIQNAAPIAIVFPKFIEFVNKYNTEGNSKWGAPIACGYNIVNYDNIITKQMVKKYGAKKENTVMFNNLHHIDAMNIIYQWFHDNRDLQAYNLTTVCNFFGINISGAHRAITDVKNTANIIMRFLKFHRELSKVYVERFRNSFKEETNV